MIVTLLVFAIVIPIAFGTIRNLVQQSTNVQDLVGSMQQDQVAGQALLQYLHSAYSVASSSTSSSLSANLEVGYSTVTATPQIATLSAACSTTATSGVGQLLVTLTPFGGSPTSQDTYYVEIPQSAASGTCPIFQFGYVQAGHSGSAVQWAASPSATAPTVALEITATFLPGPRIPTEGAAAQPSTLQTEIYLQNASATPAPNTATTLSAASSPAVDEPVTLSANVLPSPDGGATSFSVTQPDGISVACPSSALTNGASSCTFTPIETGSYAVSVQYSGDQSFNQSTSSTTLNIAYDTSTSLPPSSAPPASTTSGGVTTINVTATVAGSVPATYAQPPAPGGKVQFTIISTNKYGRQSTVTPSACVTGIAVSAGQAICQNVPITAGAGNKYTGTATFVPTSGSYYGSSSPSSTWSY
ncbi:MAG TPA: Ig-like domain repeat protein [Acidimicrobiales bacterium]|nr:Ig-like domain repeat protein [Acidimicrobiales bacterium]